MDMLLVAMAALASPPLAAGALLWWTWRPVVRHRVLVQLHDGVAMDGVVLSRRGPLLVLGDVTARIGDGQRLDGTVVVERRHVTWVQVLS